MEVIRDFGIKIVLISYRLSLFLAGIFTFLEYFY